MIGDLYRDLTCLGMSVSEVSDLTPDQARMLRDNGDQVVTMSLDQYRRQKRYERLRGGH